MERMFVDLLGSVNFTSDLLGHRAHHGARFIQFHHVLLHVGCLSDHVVESRLQFVGGGLTNVSRDQYGSRRCDSSYRGSLMPMVDSLLGSCQMVLVFDVVLIGFQQMVSY